MSFLFTFSFRELDDEFNPSASAIGAGLFFVINHFQKEKKSK